MSVHVRSSLIPDRVFRREGPFRAHGTRQTRLLNCSFWPGSLVCTCATLQVKSAGRAGDPIELL
eukprot:scaffold427_cov263-Pinguiococcus_pyrenoidosus.AAC.22